MEFTVLIKSRLTDKLQPATSMDNSEPHPPTGAKSGVEVANPNLRTKQSVAVESAMPHRNRALDTEPVCSKPSTKFFIRSRDQNILNSVVEWNDYRKTSLRGFSRHFIVDCRMFCV